jgi:hypothetical protein
MSALLEAALSYARKGRRVVPLHHVDEDGRCSCGGCSTPGKHPRVGNEWQHKATTDEAMIRRWWEMFPNANIGYLTGDRIGVLDVDPRHGGDKDLAELEGRHGKLPATAEVATGGGGRHLFYKVPAGTRTRDLTEGGGLELKAEGAFVVAAPSIHASGREYVWIDRCAPVEAPAWLLGGAARQQNGAAPAVGERIGPGARNKTLASMAGSMRRRGAAEDEILPALLAMNARRCDPPLPEEEIGKIARSVARYEPESDSSAEGGSRPETREGTTTTTPERYASRRVDVAARLAEPPRPTPWRCDEFVADGTLTVLASQSGDGKSWLALALAVGVARGRAVAGIVCRKGTPLYVDGEMGCEMFVERLRAAGIGAEFELRDAMGLDFSREDDLAWLRGEIEAGGANLVVIDSLRRLVPSKSENDSDDMAPAVAALAKLARDTRAAIVLVHHMGDNVDKFFRGSSAIKDQADALFALLRDENDPDVRRLACRGGKGKMRYAAEPADRYLVIEPERGGVEAVDEPEAETAKPISEAVKAGILAQLPARTKTEVAKGLGRRLEDRTLREAWKELQAGGKIAQNGDKWVVVVPESLGMADYYHPNGGPPEREATPEEEQLIERLKREFDAEEMDR